MIAKAWSMQCQRTSNVWTRTVARRIGWILKATCILDPVSGRVTCPWRTLRQLPLQAVPNEPCHWQTRRGSSDVATTTIGARGCSSNAMPTG